MYNDGFTTIGKARSPLVNTANEYEHLPYNFDGSQGPTANRPVRDPMRRIIASDAQAQMVATLAREMRRKGGPKMSRRKMRRLMDQYNISREMLE